MAKAEVAVSLLSSALEEEVFGRQAVSPFLVLTQVFCHVHIDLVHLGSSTRTKTFAEYHDVVIVLLSLSFPPVYDVSHLGHFASMLFDCF